MTQVFSVDDMPGSCRTGNERKRHLIRLPEKTRSLSRIILSLALILSMWLVPVAGAENLTSGIAYANGTANTVANPADLFITIDPIGDHVIGDVFFINGTTNLPVTENLTMDISKIPLRTQKNTHDPHIVVKKHPDCYTFLGE